MVLVLAVLWMLDYSLHADGLLGDETYMAPSLVTIILLCLLRRGVVGGAVAGRPGWKWLI